MQIMYCKFYQTNLVLVLHSYSEFLINNGILPLVIEAKDQDFFNDHDTYKIVNIKEVVANNGFVKVINETTNDYIEAKLTLSPREKVMINYGGLLNAIKELGGDF